MDGSVGFIPVCQPGLSQGGRLHCLLALGFPSMRSLCFSLGDGNTAFQWGLEMPLSSMSLRDPPLAADAGGAYSVPC